jgi:hypothetical protein
MSIGKYRQSFSLIGLANLFLCQHGALIQLNVKGRANRSNIDFSWEEEKL